MFASTAGTIAPQMADTLAVHSGLYLIGTFVLAFLILPLALGHRVASAHDILKEMRSPSSWRCDDLADDGAA